MQTSYRTIRTLETSQIYKIATKINKKTSFKNTVWKQTEKIRLVVLNRFICNKYIKVRSKWHEETSSNEWDELGNDCTCRKNRHRPVLVKANYGHSSWKSLGVGTKFKSLPRKLCVHGRVQHPQYKTPIKLLFSSSHPPLIHFIQSIPLYIQYYI